MIETTAESTDDPIIAPDSLIVRVMVDESSESSESVTVISPEDRLMTRYGDAASKR